MDRLQTRILLASRWRGDPPVAGNSDTVEHKHHVKGDKSTRETPSLDNPTGVHQRGPAVRIGGQRLRFRMGATRLFRMQWPRRRRKTGFCMCCSVRRTVAIANDWERRSWPKRRWSTNCATWSPSRYISIPTKARRFPVSRAFGRTRPPYC